MTDDGRQRTDDGGLAAGGKRSALKARDLGHRQSFVSPDDVRLI